jgi:hypothetical protein
VRAGFAACYEGRRMIFFQIFIMQNNSTSSKLKYSQYLNYDFKQDYHAEKMIEIVSEFIHQTAADGDPGASTYFFPIDRP